MLLAWHADVGNKPLTLTLKRQRRDLSYASRTVRWSTFENP